MKVVIYDGSLTPPTFVRFLTENLANTPIKVYLAGKGNQLFVKRNKKGVHLLPIYTRSVTKVPFIVLIAFVGLLFANPRKLGVVVTIASKEKRFSNKLFYFTLLSRLYTVKPDIIHIQWSQHVELFERIIDKGDFKFVVSFRGRLVNICPYVDSKVADLYKRTFPKVDGFHAVSEAILKNGSLFGADTKKAKVVNPAVSDELFYNQKIDNIPYVNNEPIRLLSVGRHHWKKGYPDAIDACKILKDRDIDFKYTIVAGGDTEELIYHIDDVGLNNNIELIDRLPHHKVLEAFKNAHIFILPSFEEGIANVVLEAMMMGVPVISTNCGGMEEVIVDRVNGWLVPLRDVVSLADTIVKVSQLKKEEIEKIVHNARNTIQDNHLQSLQTQKMVELYQQVV